MSQVLQRAGSGSQESASGLPPEARHKRQQRMAALALANERDLEDAATQLAASISYSFLRRPEAGLLMVEGRAGNSGRRFNLGEMLVTRCVVRLEGQGGVATEGYSFIQGNRPRHAELAAVFDALLQQPRQDGEALEQSLIAPLAARRSAELRQRAERTAATKVDFFTLVRGEDE